MNRLQAEFHRLYLPPSPDGRSHDFGEPGLIGAEGRMRAMVLGLARPADWPELSALWRGVQADLELPAPAIAVNGVDGYQLWFSLSEPVPVAQAHAFLDALRQRYLGTIAPDRLAMRPSVMHGLHRKRNGRRGAGLPGRDRLLVRLRGAGPGRRFL